MSTQKKDDHNKQDTEFMLAEYEMIKELRRDVISLGESRVNIFLAGLSGSAIGLTLINQIPGNNIIIFVIDTIILLGLILWGQFVLFRTVEVNISGTIYTRGLNRIRHYFVKKSPELINYLILSVHDDFPSLRFLNLKVGGNLSSVVALINSVLISISAVLLLSVILIDLVAQIIFASVAIFIASYYLQYRYIRSRFQKAEKGTSINFPTNILLNGKIDLNQTVVRKNS